MHQRTNAASRRNGAHLHLAPTPGPAAPMTPVDAAYHRGVIETLAAQVDVRHQALAGLDRLEAMGVDELESLIEVATAILTGKRQRPGLRLAADGGELVTA